MIDQPYFDPSLSLAERVWLGVAALGAALLTTSLAMMAFYL